MQKIVIKIPKLKTRVTWDFNPVTRTRPSKKLYSRNENKISLRLINLRQYLST